MNEESQVPKQAVQQQNKPATLFHGIHIPDYDPTTETLEEYADILKRIIMENLESFGRETVRVKALLVQIRSATNLNTAKRMAREFMEQRGGV